VVHVLAVGTPRVRKALQTLLALKRFLTAVQSIVLRQVVLVFKCLWAHVTLVRSKDVDLKMSHNKILLVIAGAQNSTSITIQFTGLVNRDSSYKTNKYLPECSYLWRVNELSFEKLLSH
jgi:hypothetical protein